MNRSAQNSHDAAAHPMCGQCGYNVTGLTTFVCPECGSDLRVVGIITRTRSLRPLMLALLWTAALPWAAAIISWLLVGYVLPVVCEQHQQRMIFCQYPQLGTIITVKRDGRAVRWGGHHGHLALPQLGSMTLEESTSRRGMRVDLRTGQWDYTDGSGKQVNGSTPFGRGALLAWLGSGGFSSQDPLVQAGADDVLQCIREMPAATFTRLSVRGGTPDITAHPTFVYTSALPLAWNAIGLAVFWIAIWLCGLGWMARRTRAVKT